MVDLAPTSTAAPESLRTPEIIEAEIQGALLLTQQERLGIFRGEFIEFRKNAVEAGVAQEAKANASGDPAQIAQVQEHLHFVQERLQKGVEVFNAMKNLAENLPENLVQRIADIEKLFTDLTSSIAEYNQFQLTKPKYEDHATRPYEEPEISLRLKISNLCRDIQDVIEDFNAEFGWLGKGKDLHTLDKEGPVLTLSKKWPPNPKENHTDEAGGLRKVYEFTSVPGMAQTLNVDVWRTRFTIDQNNFRRYAESLEPLLIESQCIGLPQKVSPAAGRVETQRLVNSALEK